MKKIFLILVMSFFFIGLSFAQDTTYHHFKYVNFKGDIVNDVQMEFSGKLFPYSIKVIPKLPSETPKDNVDIIDNKKELYVKKDQDEHF